jgi:hypothetical protein
MNGMKLKRMDLVATVLLILFLGLVIAQSQDLFALLLA